MLFSRVWLPVLAFAAAAVVVVDTGRIHRLDYVSGQGQSAARPGAPGLIVPERSNRSFEWLGLTREMLAHREWRVRRIDYENAPFGRSVSTPSPYRWWLGALTMAAPGAGGAALDFAAKLADPAIHLAVLLAATGLAAAWFGPWAASAVALGVAFLFPLGAAFLPGAPDDRGCACGLELLAVLVLLAPANGRRGRAVAAGILLGLAFWLNVVTAVPVLLGIAAGASIAGWTRREEPEVADWRAWSAAGAITLLLAFLAEYAPAHLRTWQLRVVHPIFALAWLGLGELVIQSSRRAGGAPGRGRAGRIVLALLAVASLPLVLWRTHDLGFIASELPSLRVARLPMVGAGTTIVSWLRAEGPSPAAWAALLPLLWLAPALLLLSRPSCPAGGRRRLVIALAAVLVPFGFACRELRSLDVTGAMAIALVAVTAGASAALPRPLRAGVFAAAVLLLVPGALLLLPPASPARAPLEEAELYELIERDLARWITAHATEGAAGAPLVLAPENLNATLHYYGGIRGLATLEWENRAGLQAAVRIASASTPEEAKELIDRRGVTHLIVPSWDPYLDVYARMGMGQMEGTFMERVHAWRLPGWLRPLPYPVPAIRGLENLSVFVFQVVPDPGDAVAFSRVAEYFAALGQLSAADSVANALRRFPASMAAWVARGEVAGARRDKEGVEAACQVLRPRLGSAAVRNLPWDVRVGLAIVLTEAHQSELARDPVRRCLAEATSARLRSLSDRSLFRLLLLGRAFGFTLPEPGLQAEALALLPPELRQRLSQG